MNTFTYILATLCIVLVLGISYLGFMYMELDEAVKTERAEAEFIENEEEKTIDVLQHTVERQQGEILSLRDRLKRCREKQNPEGEAIN